MGSVMPVRKAVRATETMRAPVALRLSGRAVRQMARAAAGRANIMIGKKPVMKEPVQSLVPLTPARKQVLSPRRTSPSALVHCPSWNHGSELSRWCRPKGMRRRLTVPKTKAAARAPKPVAPGAPALSSQPPIFSLSSQLKAG